MKTVLLMLAVVFAFGSTYAGQWDDDHATCRKQPDLVGIWKGGRAPGMECVLMIERRTMNLHGVDYDVAYKDNPLIYDYKSVPKDQRFYGNMVSSYSSFRPAIRIDVYVHHQR
jgi:hypothetical protein